MVEDSERLRYPDLDVWGWDSGHSGITETSYIPHLRAGFARHEHKDRGLALTGSMVHHRDLMGENPRRSNDLRRGRPDHAEGTGRARRLSCDDAGVGGSRRPPTLRCPAAGRRASRPR